VPDIQYAASLGTKPTPLADLEAKIWQIVSAVATGSDADKEMKKLFEEFDTMMFLEKPLIPDWFSQG
jgi:hypothetical protein